MARNVGKHTHRFKSNPRERIAAELWQQECGNPPIGGPDMLNYMLGNGKDPVEVSDRDREVAATVIQWLGSPIGNNFLRELLERFNKASTYAYDGTDCGCPEAICQHFSGN